MTEDDWVAFAHSGAPKVASVGRLGADLCADLRCSNNLVRLRHDYAIKLVLKHGFDPHTLPMMEQALLFGRVISDRKWHLTFFHYDEIVFGSWFQLTIKSAARGEELWVCSFYNQSHAEVTRKSNKHRLVRAEKA